MIREFYQEEAYLRLESDLNKGEPLWYPFNCIEGGIPLIKRQVPGSNFKDLISPYGYPGIVTDCKDVNVISRELSMFDSFCRSEGIITTFLRLNPIYNPLLLEEHELLKQLIHGRVVTVRLDGSHESIRMGYSSNHRRDIKKLVKNGYTVVEESIDSIKKFMDVYEDTMRRLQAASYFFFPKYYYQKLSQLSSEFILVFAKNIQGEIVSSAIFMVSDDVVQYHLGGTYERHINESPNKLIFDYIIKRYSSKKRYLVLGGGLNNAEDSLFSFKYGFSKVTRWFSTVRMVHMKDQYLNLSKDYGLPKDQIMKFEGFFPLYRRSLRIE